MECVYIEGTFRLSFVRRLSSFGGYFVWSVYMSFVRKVCLFFGECPLSEIDEQEIR